MFMKRYFSFLMLACLFCGMTCLTTSCTSDEEEILQDETVFSETDLIGLWKNNSNEEYWRYKDDHTGVYWDAADGMNEELAATGSGLFQWYIDDTGLMHLFYMETTGGYSDPDPDAPYIIETLNATTLRYVTNGGQGTRITLTRQ